MRRGIFHAVYTAFALVGFLVRVGGFRASHRHDLRHSNHVPSHFWVVKFALMFAILSTFVRELALAVVFNLIARTGSIASRHAIAMLELGDLLPLANWFKNDRLWRVSMARLATTCVGARCHMTGGRVWLLWSLVAIPGVIRMQWFRRWSYWLKVRISNHHSSAIAPCDKGNAIKGPGEYRDVTRLRKLRDVRRF